MKSVLLTPYGQKKKHFSQNKNCSISDAKIKQPLSLHVKLQHGGHKADVYDITK